MKYRILFEIDGTERAAFHVPLQGFPFPAGAAAVHANVTTISFCLLVDSLFVAFSTCEHGSSMLLVKLCRGRLGAGVGEMMSAARLPVLLTN